MSGKVITISQQKGGAGKTTITAHLSVAFAQKGFNVAILDIDPQRSLTAWYQARTKTFGEGNTSLTLLTISDNWRIRARINELRKNHDIVLIDCPPHTKNDTQIAVKEADLVIVPIQPSPTDLWATTQTIELTNKENKNTFLLLNRVVANSKLAKRFIEELPRCRLRNVINNRIIYPSIMADGRCATETKKCLKASKEIENVLSEVHDALFFQGEVAVEEYSSGESLQGDASEKTYSGNKYLDEDGQDTKCQDTKCQDTEHQDAYSSSDKKSARCHLEIA